MRFRRWFCSPLAALALAATGCAGFLPPSAQATAAADGEWVSGPADLRKLTAIVRVTPPARLKATFEEIAAKSDDPDFGDFLRAHAAGGFGSGFVMVHERAGKPRAFIVTNRHVVAGSTDAEVSFSDGTTYKACEIVFVSPKHDLAVLALPDSALKTFGYGLRPRAAAPSDLLPVVATGYPGVVGSPSYQITDGKISNATFSLPDRGFDETLVQHTAPIDPGSSGGPLTDTDGALVGVNVMLIRKRASMFFAVPASAVTETVRTAHELLEERESAQWMRADLEKACSTLSAELSSTAATGAGLMPFVSNELVTEQGLPSYLFMLRTKSGPDVRKLFFEEPIQALRVSVMARLAIRSEVGGGAVGGCSPVHPGDAEKITEGKRVRVSVKTRKGDMELAWTFEQGAWRVAGGDLVDIRGLLSMEEEAPAEPERASHKPSKTTVARKK